MRGSSSISGRAWALSALCLQIFAGLGPDLGYGLFGLLQPSLLDRSDLLSFYGPPGHSATSGAEEGGAGGEEPSGLHRAIVTARPSWQVVPNAAALWWSGKPLRSVVVGLKDRFSFGHKLLRDLLGRGSTFSDACMVRDDMSRRGKAGSRSYGVECVLLVAQNQRKRPPSRLTSWGSGSLVIFLNARRAFTASELCVFGPFWPPMRFFPFIVFSPNTIEVRGLFKPNGIKYH